MALTQAEIDALRAAIATGVKRVAYADRSVEYHSLKEMLDALAVVEAAVLADSGEIRSTFAKFRSD